MNYFRSLESTQTKIKSYYDIEDSGKTVTRHSHLLGLNKASQFDFKILIAFKEKPLEFILDLHFLILMTKRITFCSHTV